MAETVVNQGIVDSIVEAAVARGAVDLPSLEDITARKPEVAWVNDILGQYNLSGMIGPFIGEARQKLQQARQANQPQ